MSAADHPAVQGKLLVWLRGEAWPQSAASVEC